MAQAGRYAGFEEILGPGYAGHGDHAHLANKSSRFWSASSCGI
jgi:zinc D-Ala-D-Ala carboxypeptidase